MGQEWALPEIDLASCNRCGVCVAQCPAGAAEMGVDGPFIARPSDCTYCAVCEAICPQGAIACVYEIVWEGEGDE
jgi:NAD-dependent dihydropyrimidine dehydrogenase PreA subunit